MSEPTPLLAPLKPAAVPAHLWDGTRFLPDNWRTIADGDALPIDGRAIVSLDRWRAEQAALVALGVPIGGRVEAAEMIDPESDDIARLAVIALVFPKFTDGRAYSTARHLREVMGYRGQIRATGDVLLDQLPLMLRCGFDAFEIVDAATIQALKTSPVPAVSRVYQGGAVATGSAWNSRRAARSRTSDGVAPIKALRSLS